jgi:hypothetical protein|tara:strand:- start:5724 stop:5912 length:189 start_codon:yes stop_codon:yes gene_type:complete
MEKSSELFEVRLKGHEDLCSLRYDNIEQRLESGNKRFDKIDKMLLGIYGIILSFAGYIEFIK